MDERQLLGGGIGRIYRQDEIDRLVLVDARRQHVVRLFVCDVADTLPDSRCRHLQQCLDDSP